VSSFTSGLKREITESREVADSGNTGDESYWKDVRENEVFSEGSLTGLCTMGGAHPGMRGEKGVEASEVERFGSDGGFVHVVGERRCCRSSNDRTMHFSTTSECIKISFYNLNLYKADNSFS
jgi:hypothetical protein